MQRSVTITLEGTTDFINRALAAETALLSHVYVMIGETNLTGVVQKKPCDSLPLFGRNFEPADLCILVEVAKEVRKRRKVAVPASLLLRQSLVTLGLSEGEAYVVMKTDDPNDDTCITLRRAA